MREIKFRGKRIDNGEWVYGCLTRYSDHMSYIVVDVTENNGTYQVLTETVGQYTGLKDKNGKEIYEGDNVKATLRFFDIFDQKCRVIFHNGSFGLQYGSLDYFKSLATWDDIEVIGNIYNGG